MRRASVPGNGPHAPIAGNIRLVLVLAHRADTKKTPYNISGHRGEGGHVVRQVAAAMKVGPEVEPHNGVLLIKDRLFLGLHMHGKDSSGFTAVELLLEVDHLRQVRGIFGFARFFFSTRATNCSGVSAAAADILMLKAFMKDFPASLFSGWEAMKAREGKGRVKGITF